MSRGATRLCAAAAALLVALAVLATQPGTTRAPAVVPAPPLPAGDSNVAVLTVAQATLPPPARSPLRSSVSKKAPQKQSPASTPSPPLTPTALASFAPTRPAALHGTLKALRAAAAEECPKPASLACVQRLVECWGNGSWVHYNMLPEARRTTRADPWVWVPSPACAAVPLPRPSRDDWCALHAGARLLFVGDSISGQMYTATKKWLTMRPQTVRDGPPVPVEPLDVECASDTTLMPHIPGCDGFTACADASVRVAFVRNDWLHLGVTRRTFKPVPVNVMMHPVHAAIAALRPTHVLLNRGAHFTEDGPFVEGVTAALRYLRAALPDAVVMLRDTPQGHAGCAAHSRPSLLPQMQDGLPFNWNTFPRQNALLRQVGAQEGVLVLNFAGPTATRPDGHLSAKDCLHYAISGGPPYTWVRLHTAGATLARLLAPPAAPTAA
jgi:hypothetical protein